MKRVRTERLLFLFVALVLAPTAVLGYYSYRYINGASQRLQMERIDAFERAGQALQAVLDGSIRELLAREEQRDYYEYQSYFYPGEQAKGYNIAPVLNRSGLARPESPMILNYFMIDEGNRVTSPGDEQVLAFDGEMNAAPRQTVEQGGSLSQGQGVQSIDSDSRIVAQQSGIQQSDYQQSEYTEELQSIDPLANYNRGKGDWNACREVPEDVVSKNSNIAELAQQLRLAEDNDVDQQDVINSYRNVKVKQQRDPAFVQVRYTPFEFLLVQELQQAQRLFCLRAVDVQGRLLRQGFEVNLDYLAGRVEEFINSLSEDAGDIRADFGGGDPGDVLMEKAVHPDLPPKFKLQLRRVSDSGTLRTLESGRALFLGMMGLLFGLVCAGLFLVTRSVRTELRVAEQQKDFLSAVTHELKTPLTGIRLYGEMLYEGMVPEGERRREYYRSIVSESERLSRLISNVLDLSKIEQGSKRYYLEARPLAASVNAAMDICGTLLSKAGFEVDVAVPESLPVLQLDSDACTQVFINLVDNAVKFSADSPKKALKISAKAEGGCVRVLVEDAGPGIPEDLRGQLFDRFRRGERELTRRTQGVGLGLALVKDIVQAHGGGIRIVDSSLGGAAFEVTFPIPS